MDSYLHYTHAELSLWQHQLKKKPGLGGRLTHGVQNKINSWIPDKVHKAITMAIENMVKAGASEFRGAYYSHGKQFIENIPIKKINFDNKEEIATYNTIVKLVVSLIKTKAQLKNAPYGSKKAVYQRKEDVLYDQLIQSINLLYGVSDEEYNSVMNDEMFTTELAIVE